MYVCKPLCYDAGLIDVSCLSRGASDFYNKVSTKKRTTHRMGGGPLTRIVTHHIFQPLCFV